MIAYVEGSVVHKGDRFVVVSAHGIGYKIFLAERLIEACSEGTHAVFWTHFAQSDHAANLYGFESPHELFFFELLITVSGIGPKTALGIINAAPVELLQRAVIENNTEHITKVSGVGKKNAEKIVLELQDKIKNTSHTFDATPAPGDGDVIDALVTLGYSQKEARDIVHTLPAHIDGTENRIREALKQMG